MPPPRRRVGKTGVLGVFEEMVLLALLHQGEDAYAVSIRRELADRLGSDIAMGAVYATLDRLAAKGLIDVRGDARPQAGPGRPRTCYETTPDGLAALEQTREARRVMWQGIRLPASAGRRPVS